MKKLTSLEDLKSLIPKDYKPESTFKPKFNIKKQTLEAHYSVKGRAGTPVIILKGFLGLKKEDLKNLAKPIKNKLGIGGSIKNNEIYFQGDKRDKIISILESQGHSVKRIGG
jgi:translation initiation factor 1